ncbi:MAG TPA: DUF4105 domain-containing protein, partial [Arenimonas sp.]|nr:DUF4105 domain-containing protein [Arenimonas sp.]
MPLPDLRLALLGLLLCVASLVQAAPRIGIATMEPGEIFWERFGHNAILVEDADGGEILSYNFGFFDPEEPNFYWNFIRGRMQYQLLALDIEQDLWWYRETGRGVTVQWLRLTPEQAWRLAADLAENARPENARYAYDYYRANCSTRVRDALDRAMDGQLYRQLSGRSLGNTYRSETVRLTAPAPWLATGLHLGLADYGDRPLSRWDEAFVPMRLRDSLREVRLADGGSLVESEQTLLPHSLPLPADVPPRLAGRALLLGLAVAAAALLLGRRKPRVLAGFAALFWLGTGLAGIVLAFIWVYTAHVAGYGNENLLLFSPLALALLPGAWQQLRGREAPRYFRILLMILLGMSALAAFIKLLP